MVVRETSRLLSTRLRPVLRYPLVLLLTLLLLDQASGAAERHLDWEATGTQQCERCGARREAKVRGPLTIVESRPSNEAQVLCAGHDWTWTGCVSTRFGILCFW